MKAATKAGLLPLEQKLEIVKLAGEGMTRESIAAQLESGVASVYRALKQASP